MKRVHVIVTGKVQGVGYRMVVQSIAERCQVQGWVRNLPDGSVEAVAEGRFEDLKLFVEGVQAKKMTVIRVDHVAVTWEEPKKEQGFRIIPYSEGE
jgi:acylphosphatase